MKKTIVLLLLTILSIPLVAFDWGGVFDNTTAFKDDLKNTGLEQNNKLTLWFRMPLNESGYLVGEGFYEFDYLENSNEITHILDINLLKFRMTVPMGKLGDLNLDIGRYGINDLTGIILSQPSDGIQASYANNTFAAATYIGFTGLLNNKSVDINGGKNPTELSSVYTPAPRFIVTSVTANLPFLFAQQSISAGFYVTLDVGEGEHKNHRAYLTALINGPIVGSLYYIFSTSLGFANGVNAKVQTSNLSAFELTVYLPFMSSMISWKTVLATGVQEDNPGFQTFTVASANIASTLDYAGHIKTGIIGTIKPIDNLLVFVGTDIFFNDMNDTAEKSFAGTQWTLSARWQVLGDIQLALSAGQFFSVEKEVDSYASADFKILISF